MSAIDLVAPRGGRSSTRRGPRPRRVVPLSMLAFWAAIALPAVYLPLLAVGIDNVEGLAAFLGLFGLHVVALTLGREHGRPAG